MTRTGTIPRAVIGPDRYIRSSSSVPTTGTDPSTGRYWSTIPATEEGMFMFDKNKNDTKGIKPGGWGEPIIDWRPIDRPILIYRPRD